MPECRPKYAAIWEREKDFIATPPTGYSLDVIIPSAEEKVSHFISKSTMRVSVARFSKIICNSGALRAFDKLC